MAEVIYEASVPFEDEELPIIWVDEFSTETAQTFIARLVKLEADLNTKEIFIYITSNGGEAYSLLAMVDAMLACSKPIHTVGLGMCASAGADLLACGTGTRWIGKNSFMHFHYSRGLMIGDTPAVEQEIKQTKEMENKIFKLITQRSNLTPAEMRKKLNTESKEWQLSAKAALKYGFVDCIGRPKFKKITIVEYEK